MADIKNIVAKNRSKLEEVIPISTPYSIVLDPCNACNFNCKFCALQQKVKSGSYKPDFKLQNMDFDLYCKIIDDIARFENKIKVFRLNGLGEPLLNPNFTKMVSYAKEKGVADYIETITNGSLLNPKLNSQLVESGIDRIRISIEALDSQGYYDITGKEVSFERIIENISDLHKKAYGKVNVYCKIVNVAVPTTEERNKFYEIFNNICDQCFIDNVIPMWSGFDEINDAFDINTNEGMHGQKIKKVKVCPYIFYSIIINPDGIVTLCCPDWKRELIVGDLKTESIIDIWNGKKIKKIWIEMLKGNKDSFNVCKECLLPEFDCNDDIDPFADVILNRLL